jgi:hypothetical protein
LQIRGDTVLQYTIETRELTNESTARRRPAASPLRTVIIARDPDDAISQYVRNAAAELVSFTQPANSQESIATVKKEDAVFLVRVYAA